MSRLLTWAVLGLSSLALPLLAHELKIFSSQYHLDADTGKATVYLSWGHRLPVDELTDAATLDRYEWLSPAGKATTLKAEGKSLQANLVGGKEPGVYQVLATRKPAVFSFVLDEEGQKQMKRGPRSEHAGAKVDSAIRSVQSAKTLLCVGKPDDKAPASVGLPLEIVPLQGPASWKARNEMRFRLLLEGRPLPQSVVLARSLSFKPDNAWNYATYSDRKGEFTLVTETPGTWVIKVLAKRPADPKQRGEFDEEWFTTTLSFEVRP